MFATRRLGIICFAAGLMVLGAGCHKKTIVSTPPTPPPPTPTAPSDVNNKTTILSFSIEPSTVERGQSAVMRWSVSNANAVSIDNGIGQVQSTGERRITPTESATYRMTAAGPSGTVNATATVNVTAPPPPTTPTRTGPSSLTDAVNTMLTDAYFDYDSNAIRPDARDVLAKDADALKKILTDFPTGSVILEGHCDERGSAEYNLGLGDQRATSARDYLVQLGVSGDRIKTVSYGKERPQCTEANESCYQRNRRAHFAAAQQ